MIDKWPKGVAQILQALTQQRIQQSSSQKQSGNPDWWKPMESALAVVGAVSDDLRMLLEDEEDKPSYDLGYLFDSVVPGLLTQNGEDWQSQRGSCQKRPSFKAVLSSLRPTLQLRCPHL